MYEGLSIGELPEEALLPWCKVRVPVHVLLHDDKTYCEGFLYMQTKYKSSYKWPELSLGRVEIPDGEIWYLTPEAIPRGNKFIKYELDLTNCDPMKDFIVIEYVG